MISFNLTDAIEALKQVDLTDKIPQLSTLFATANDMIYNQVVANANSSITQRGKNKYGLKINDGIAKTIYKQGKGASTYITRKGNYILYFLAHGTKERQTKKKYNRGKLNENPFFKNAVDSQLSNVANYIESEINKIITPQQQ